MKRIALLLTVLVSLSLSSVSMAQDKLGGRKGMKDVPTELRLTDAQRKEMKEIKVDYQKKIDAVEKTRLAPEAQKSKIENLRTEQREAIENVMTLEQKEYFSKNMKEGRDSRKTGEPRKYGSKAGKDEKERYGQGTKGKNREYCVMYNLDLTDAQKEEMKKLDETQQKEHNELMKKHREQKEKILTPAQLTKLNENREKKVE